MFALVFPGQGSQAVGMGRELCEASAVVRGVFEQAAGVVNFDLLELAFSGPAAELTKTQYAQPAILATSFACLTALQARLGEISMEIGRAHV